MIKIITGCWGGKYPDYYVDRMESMVARNISQPFEFIAIRRQHLPGWWNKMAILDMIQGPALWLDIDSVLTGPLDPLVIPLAEGSDIRTAKNWAQSGHGGCQSSAMYWQDASAITSRFETSVIDSGLWGDQEFITQLRDQGLIRVEYFDERLVRSYKYHARPIKKAPAGASVVTFHGKPDPHEVNEQWIKDHWDCSTTIQA